MATTFNFNNRVVKLPGVYTQVKSGIDNQPLSFSYGNVLLIDTDDTSLYGGGAGVNGEHASGEDAIYEFNSIRDLQDFLGGGKFWDLAAPLFRPFGAGSLGASKVYLIRALTTTAASESLGFTNGTVVFDVKHEGLPGNGVETSSVLTQGFAITLESGVTDTAKFILKFWRGTFTGNHADGRPYNNVLAADAKPILVAETPEIADLSEITSWAAESADFQNHFVLTTGDTGAIVAGDLTTLAGNNLFSGGTQSNTATSIDDVLTAVKKLDYSHVLAPDQGASADSTDNTKILAHILNDAVYEKFMVVAGGDDSASYAAQSIAKAQALDSHRVILVHGGVKENDSAGGSGFRDKDALHKAAYVLGRVSGLTPQTPPTFKGLGYAGETHKLTDAEKEQGLDAGVLTTFYDSEIGAFVITQGINTLQANRFVVNGDGTSHQWQLMRIMAQLNKELQIEAKIKLLANQNQGPNRATLSEEIVAEFTKSFLSSRTATETNDNYILSFQDITTGIKGDAYFINYAVVPNFEVNKLFFTSLILDPSI